MPRVIIPNASSLAILQELIATGNLLDGVKLRLFQNDFTPVPASVLADFTIATFTGFATSTAVVWGTPYYQQDGTPNVAGDLKTFAAGSPLTVTNVIYGWYLIDGAASVWLAAYRFDQPIPVSIPLQAIPVVPSYPMTAF